MRVRAFKTRSELKLEHLERIGRPLTDKESDELRRALHATYCLNRKRRLLAAHEREEAKLLAKVEVESRNLDPGRWER